MQKVIEIARKEIGYVESPPNTNRTKYGQWFGFDGVPWCGMFVSWCFAQAKMPLGNIGFKKGFAGCQTAVAHYRAKGQVIKEPVPGCIVFFDFNGDGRFDHTGIFVRDLNGETFETVEGNTSLINQRNGGSVMLRVRRFLPNVIFVNPFSNGN